MRQLLASLEGTVDRMLSAAPLAAATDDNDGADCDDAFDGDVEDEDPSEVIADGGPHEALDASGSSGSSSSGARSNGSVGISASAGPGSAVFVQDGAVSALPPCDCSPRQLSVLMSLAARLRARVPWRLQQRAAAAALAWRGSFSGAEMAGLAWALTAQDFHPGTPVTSFILFGWC